MAERVSSKPLEFTELSGGWEVISNIRSNKLKTLDSAEILGDQRDDYKGTYFLLKTAAVITVVR